MSTERPETGGSDPPVSEDRRQLLNRMMERERASVDRFRIRPVGRDHATYPLSFAQERLWFLHRLDPTNPGYHILLPLPFGPKVDVPALQAAVDHLVARHEGLRTTFPDRDGTPVQVIHDPAPVELSHSHLRELKEIERLQALAELLQATAMEPFDLAKGPVFRPRLVQMDDVHFYLILSMHHIVTDGWSSGLLIRDLKAAYDAFSSGEALEVPPLAVQSVDFAVWQRERMKAGAFKEDLAYWRDQLAGSTPSSLPFDRPRSPHPSSVGASTARPLAPSVVAGLKALSSEEGTTLFMTVLAAFAAFLGRVAGQTDVSIGTPVSGHRERPELSQVIGCFLNMIVLRVDVSGEPPFRELIARVQKTARDGFAKQHIPFEAIVREIQPDRDAGANPLFNVTFTLDQPDVGALGLIEDPILRQAVGAGAPTIRFDLEVNVLVTPENTFVVFNYAKDLFDTETVDRWVDQYCEMLEVFASDPSEPVTRLAASSDSLLTTTELLSHLRSLGVRLWTEEEKLRVSAPSGVLTAELRTELADRKQEILGVLREAVRSGAAAAIPTVRRDGELAVSMAQQRLWFLDRLDPGSPAYNVAGAIRSDRFDTEAMGLAIDEMIERHEVLRSTFPTVQGEPRLFIHSPTRGNLEVIDLSSMPPGESEPAALALVAERVRKGFDLGKGPLFRASLVHLTPKDSILVYCLHHIICDGWSMEVFGREMNMLLSAGLAGRKAELPELPVQYVDFAAWQRDRFETGAVDDQLKYWTKQLGGSLPVIELPTDRPRPPVQTLSGAIKRFSVAADLANDLKALGSQEGVTLFMTLLATFKVLLFRYTGGTDIVVGMPTAGRDRPELENVMGFFVNNVVLRTSAAGRPTFREFLHQTRKVMLGAHANQELPFDQLVETLRPERTMSHPPLFQVMFNSPTEPREDYRQSQQFSVLDIDLGTSRFDLTVDVAEHVATKADGTQDRTMASGLTLSFEYNTDLFDEETIVRLYRSYIRLLEGVVERPDERVSLLPLVTDADRHELLVTWNDTAADYRRDACIHQLIESQVAEHGDRTAVVAGPDSLTYGELNAQSERLARRLRALGVGPGVLVGLCVDRSVGMMIALIGILKAGGAYVPLDPTYPVARLRFMLEDSAAPVLVTQSHLRELLPTDGVEVVSIDEDVPDDEVAEATQAAAQPSPEDLAYVIYTSGSTGKPKGVQITHRSVVNFLTSMAREPGLSASDRLLAVTTLSFDIGVLELYLPLTVGAQVTIASRSEAMDALRLAELIDSSGATVMQATPAGWRLLVQSGWQGCSRLRMLCGGEALERELAERLLPLGASLWNLYGPTETTIWSTLLRIDEDVAWPVSIGRPIANTQVYILDADRNPVPVGVAGELYIGGDGLARGYLNRPELTVERFVPHPFHTDGEARLYRTGDSARFRRDGTIEFLGRLDSQVKIRGFRIELGEIESNLNEHPDVAEAAVTLREDVPGDQRLVAYVVPSEGREVDPATLQRHLKLALPDYMAPSVFVALEKLPRTPNGKTDRDALPAPDGSDAAVRAAFVAPETDTERVIAEVWQEILRVEKVGREDNFFDLGGHSLLAVRVHSALSGRLERSPSLIDLFQHTTVTSLAQYLSRDGEERPTFDQARQRAERQLES